MENIDGKVDRGFAWEIKSWLSEEPCDLTYNLWAEKAHDGTIGIRVANERDIFESIELSAPEQVDELIARLTIARNELWPIKT